MKKQALLILLFVGMLQAASAQLSRYTTDGDLNMKMSFRYGAINNTQIAESETVGGLVFRFYDLGLSNYTDSPWQYSGRWATLPETFSLIVFDVIFTQNFNWFSYQPNVTLLGDFIMGWHNFSYSLY
jgi:hypothetical protein